MTTPTTPTPLQDRMAPEDEAAYVRLAQDPTSTAADLQAFARQRGFDVTDDAAHSFLASRSRKGATVGGTVTYEVEGPDGSTYAVDAPAGATEAEVLARVQAYTRPNTFGENVTSTAGEVLDGVLPGAGRFMAGVGGAAGNTIAAGLGWNDWHPGEAFAEEQAGYDRNKARLGHDNPTLASAAGWTGTIGGFALPAAKVFQGGKLAAGVGNGVLTGAGYGALSGALNDSGGGRLENAALGGFAGGALGAAGPLAARKLADTAGALRRNIPFANEAATFLENVPRRLTGREPVPATAAAYAQAERLLDREMQGATIATGMGAGDVQASPARVLSEVSRRQALGTPAVPADTSERLRGVLAEAMRSDRGPALAARGVLSSRQAQQGQRVRGALSDMFGPAVDPLQEAEKITARAAAAARPAYQAAYAQPMIVTPEIEGIMRTPAFQDALPRAVENIRNGLGDPQALGFRFDGAGNLTGVETLSTEGFDQVIRAMRDAGQAAMDRSGFRPRNTTDSVHINARAGDLRDHLAAQNDHYRDAVSGYADEMAVRDALERGQDVAKLSGHEINAQLRDMPDHAREAWTAGAATVLADRATQAGLRPGTNVALSTRQALGLPGAGLAASTGDQAKQGAIEAAAGRPGVLRGLDDRLEAEDQTFQTYAAVRPRGRGALSSENLADGAGAALGVVRKAAQGRILGALSDAVLRANPKGTAAFRGDVNDRLVGILSASEPGAVREGLEAVARRADTDRTRHRALHSAGAHAAKFGALYAAAQSTDPLPLDVPDSGLAGPAQDLDALAPLYGRWAPPGPSSGFPGDPSLAPIAKALPDGRKLQGFTQAPDGTFQPNYAFTR